MKANSSIRNLIQQASPATVGPDEVFTEPPRYTIWDLFGSRKNPSKGKFGPTGIIGMGSDFYNQKVAQIEERVQRLAMAGGRPEVPGANDHLAYGPFKPVMETNAQFMPGLFEYMGVPFHITEPKATGQAVFERNYGPTYKMRIITELEILRACNPIVSRFIGTTNWEYDDAKEGESCSYGGQPECHPLPDGSNGDNPPLMRHQSLHDFLLLLNRFTGKYGNDTRAKLSNWVVAQMPYLLLKTIKPTIAEWNEPWGAFKFFGRGGFVLNAAIAEGQFPLGEYMTDYYNDARQGGMPIVACATWVRDPRWKTGTGSISGEEVLSPSQAIFQAPAGRPVCIAAAPAPGDIDPNNRILWKAYIDIREPTYHLRLLPYQGDAQWSVADWADKVTSWTSDVIRLLCDSNNDTAKVTQALIAFTKLQGKSAQDATAKAKTEGDKVKAAQMAANYKEAAIALQLAVGAANLYCAGNPIPMGGLPPVDLPAMEPPIHNPKFGLQEMLDASTGGYAGRNLSLSPDVLIHSSSWSKFALLFVAAASGGAYAFRRKSKTK